MIGLHTIRQETPKSRTRGSKQEQAPVSIRNVTGFVAYRVIIVRMESLHYDVRPNQPKHRRALLGLGC
jgi:hypothetical protein